MFLVKYDINGTFSGASRTTPRPEPGHTAQGRGRRTRTTLYVTGWLEGVQPRSIATDGHDLYHYRLEPTSTHFRLSDDAFIVSTTTKGNAKDAGRRLQRLGTTSPVSGDGKIISRALSET